MPVADRRSPLAVVVLALLAERPMHPYLMFQLITERGKTSIVNITQRNSLYQVINRLVRSGLAEVDSTERSENRPERTVYRITELGSETVRAWLRQMLTAEKPEYPEFPAALSLMALISPSDVLAGLESRMIRLESQRASIESGLATASEMELPRLFVLDDAYRLAMIDAEIAWVRGVLAELRSGALSWSQEWVEQVAARFEPED